MRIIDADFIKGFIKMADDGFLQGWHERNGGNLSYRIRPEEVDEIRDHLSYEGNWLYAGTQVPGLSGEYFLITGTGSYFRNIRSDQESNIGIIELDGKGENYRILWGLKKNGRPTSELPTHLMNHEVKIKTSNGINRVIYHSHPANIIALTFVLPLDGTVFTRELWEMITECPIVFPEGVGVIGWRVPGKKEVAIETSRCMLEQNVVIWAHHGIFCSGKDYDDTFGLAETVEKSAEVLVKVLSMCQEKRQTISLQNFKELAADYRLDLSERYLFEK